MKLVAALLRVAVVTAGLAESNGSLPPGLWLTSLAGWLPRTRISCGILRSVIEYGLPLLFRPWPAYKCVGLFTAHELSTELNSSSPVPVWTVVLRTKRALTVLVSLQPINTLINPSTDHICHGPSGSWTREPRCDKLRVVSSRCGVSSHRRRSERLSRASLYAAGDTGASTGVRIARTSDPLTPPSRRCICCSCVWVYRWLGEEMYGAWSWGFKTKGKTKEDLERGCMWGLSST